MPESTVLPPENISSLRLIQLLSLSVLVDFSKACSRNNIPFFIVAGTLLGAYREKRFIPWDTDIDVAMMRDDYNRFIKLSSDTLPDNLVIHHLHDDSRYSKTHARIFLKNTVFTKSSSSSPSEDGIFIDIFPLDNSPSNPSFFDKIASFMFRLFSRVLEFRNGRIHSVKLINKVATYISVYSLSFLPNSALLKLLNWLPTRHKTKIGFVTNYSSKYGISRYNMPLNIYFPSILLEFEGFDFPAPVRYLEYLSNIYGDLNPPPYSKNMMKVNSWLSQMTVDFGPYDYLLDLPEPAVVSTLFPDI